MWSLAAFGTGVILLILVLFVPFMHGLFMVTSIKGMQMVYIVGMAVIPTVIIQTVKLIKEKIGEADDSKYY